MRVCGAADDTVRAVFGTGPTPQLAAGGTMTLHVSGLTRQDSEPGAIAAVTDDAVIVVRELSIGTETWGNARVVLEGVAPGSSSLSIRRVDGDLLIDRTRVSVAAVASARVVAPALIGCVRPEQVLYRAVEVAPVAELLGASGAVLVDEGAHVTTADGEPLGPIAAGIDRVSLVVVGGDARTSIEIDVVDRADAIERASAARLLLLDQSRAPTELFPCFRAVHGDREVVGALFEFEEERADRRFDLGTPDGSPQCLQLGGTSSGAVLHVRAAGTELVRAAQ